MTLPAPLPPEDSVTTRARAWALFRRDGLVLGFTDHDSDLAFDGIVFRARAGMSARAFVQTTGLAVDNSEALGALTNAGLTEEDILAGRWDGAQLTVWDVDWSNPSDRRVLFRGRLGEITRQGLVFRAELRGLSQLLQEGRGRIFAATCDAILGDRRCQFQLDQPGFTFETPLVSISETGDALVVALSPAPPEGWFAEGVIEVLDGPAQGLNAVIRADRQVGEERHLALWAAFGLAPRAGDRLRLRAGCDKRLETCREKFSNVANFRGFPHLPGEEWLIAAPRPGARGGKRGSLG